MPNINELKIHIDKVRSILNHMVEEEENFVNPQIIMVSQILDDLLNELSRN